MMRKRGIMRRRAAILLLALTPLMLGSCSTEGIDSHEPTLDCASIEGTDAQECRIPLSDRQHVTCVIYDGWREAAMTCDWEHEEGADNL